MAPKILVIGDSLVQGLDLSEALHVECFPGLSMRELLRTPEVYLACLKDERKVDWLVCVFGTNDADADLLVNELPRKFSALLPSGSTWLWVPPARLNKCKMLELWEEEDDLPIARMPPSLLKPCFRAADKVHFNDLGSQELRKWIESICVSV